MIALKMLICVGGALFLLWFMALWQGVGNSIMMGQRGGGFKNIFLPFIDGIRFLSVPRAKEHSLATSFLALLVAFLPFTAFPLCQAFVVDGEQFFPEYHPSGQGVIFVWVVLLFHWPMAYLLKNKSRTYLQELVLLECGINFISYLVLGPIILLSLFLSYQSFDFHTIVAQQNSTVALFRWPLAGILFFVCCQIGSCSGPFASSLEEDDSFLLKFLQKMHTLSLTILFVFVFMGGYALIPGLAVVAKIIPHFLLVLQFFSLLVKIALVFLALSIFTYSFPRYRSTDTINLLFKCLMPLALGHLLVVFYLKGDSP